MIEEAVLGRAVDERTLVLHGAHELVSASVLGDYEPRQSSTAAQIGNSLRTRRNVP